MSSKRHSKHCSKHRSKHRARPPIFLNFPMHAPSFGGPLRFPCASFRRLSAHFHPQFSFSRSSSGVGAVLCGPRAFPSVGVVSAASEYCGKACRFLSVLGRSHSSSGAKALWRKSTSTKVPAQKPPIVFLLSSFNTVQQFWERERVCSPATRSRECSGDCSGACRGEVTACMFSVSWT